MRRLSHFPILLSLLAIAVSCVELPLERNNFLDPGSGTTISLVGIPDTLNSVGETFEITVTLTPQPSASAARPEIVVEIPDGVLQRTGALSFASTSGAGYVPVRAVIEASLAGVVNGPFVRKSLVIRQRPDSLQLRCISPDGCATAPSGGTTLRLEFSAFDARDQRVSFPDGAFRYGTVVSRHPDRVSIAGRPTPSAIEVRTGVAGVTWIVMAGETGRADSLRIEVLP